MSYLEALDKCLLYEQKASPGGTGSRPLTALGVTLLWKCINQPEQKLPPTLKQLWEHAGLMNTCLVRLNVDAATSRTWLASEMKRPAFLEPGAIRATDFDFLPDGDTFRAIVVLNLPMPFQLFTVQPKIEMDKQALTKMVVWRSNARYIKRMRAKRRRAKRRRDKRRR